MKPEMRMEIEALAGMSIAGLREKYRELTGESTSRRSAAYLRKRCCWLIQAREHGGLSAAARRRAHELARLSDLRLVPPETKPERVVRTPVKSRRGPDLPPPGTLLTRRYQGQQVRVLVLDNGLEWNGATYRSLSAIAKAVTGTHCSGPRWFGLVERKRTR